MRKEPYYYCYEYYIIFIKALLRTLYISLEKDIMMHKKKNIFIINRY